MQKSLLMNYYFGKETYEDLSNEWSIL